MYMSATDIAKEYRTAKSPRAQIGILADLNGCTKQEIADILIAQGEPVPKYYQKHKNEKDIEKVLEAARREAEAESEAEAEPEPEPEPEDDPSVELFFKALIRSAAVNVIDNMLRIRNFADPERRETASRDFEMQLRGVMALVHQLEESKDDELAV